MPILEALRQPATAISYFMTQALVGAHRDKHVFAADGSPFNLLGYPETGNCEVTQVEGVTPELQWSWQANGKPLYRSTRAGRFQVVWNGHALEAIILVWPSSLYSNYEHVWLIADTEDIARSFYYEVCRWANEVREEVLVFSGDCWSKSRELARDIGSSTAENLILDPLLKEAIWGDFERFFASKEMYAAHGIPWKRGVLLLGPPGNGKSHTVKALINHLGLPALYIKSLLSQHSTEHVSIQSIFKKARDMAPCLLILEDLDSHLQKGNRSFFLNELDGFASNEGVLTLATSNYPERLDPSILQRPSRFDRKYHFGLPALAERQRFLTYWNERAEVSLRMDPAEVEEIAVGTDGFSFAYLRELVISSRMQWIHEQSPMAGVMHGQLSLLRQQMSTSDEVPGYSTPIGLLDED